MAKELHIHIECSNGLSEYLPGAFLSSTELYRQRGVYLNVAERVVLVNNYKWIYLLTM